ncbi:amidohydrolase family protein [Nocardioides sp. NPDC101246]|uniref:amidohydrolase family protein n=1 Tax=Nocardioides sp. NPDC101246 TaxID=3364336 RepID=UPI00380B8476
MTYLSRRAFVGGAGAAAGALTIASDPASAAPPPVPFSAGTNRPAFPVPYGAVDCHIHILEPERFPYPNPTSTPPPRASVDDYRLLRRRLRTTRAVVVTPSNYATDNRCTLDAIARLGRRDARGVAVIGADTTDAELVTLHAGGIRGIRFNLTRSGGAGAELIRPLAERIAPFGWHVQVHMTADGIIENLPVLTDLPTDLVIDHLGRIPGDAGTSHPAFGAIRNLIDAGRTWVKLSGVYLESTDGPPAYADRSTIAKAFVRAAPERMVWGTDWPHTTASRGEVPMPNDADLVNLFADWAGDRRTIRQILVDNPETLYDFEPLTAVP